MEGVNEKPAVWIGLIATVLYGTVLHECFDWTRLIGENASSTDIVLVWLEFKLRWWLGIIFIWSTVCLSVHASAQRTYLQMAQKRR